MIVWLILMLFDDSVRQGLAGARVSSLNTCPINDLLLRLQFDRSCDSDSSDLELK